MLKNGNRLSTLFRRAEHRVECDAGHFHLFAEADCLSDRILQSESSDRNGAEREKFRSGLLHRGAGLIAECPHRSLMLGDICGEFRLKRLHFA